MIKKANNDMPSAEVAPTGQTKPTINPLLENKEMDKNLKTNNTSSVADAVRNQFEFALIKKANDYFNKAKSDEVETKDIYESQDSAGHRGRVTDPAHDRRLKENRDDSSQEEDTQKKQKEEAQKRKEEIERQQKFNEEMSKKVNKNPIKPTLPKLASSDEIFLKSHHKFGNLFTKDKLTNAYLEKIYNKLKSEEKNLHSASQVQEYNEVISHLANLMLSKGFLK